MLVELKRNDLHYQVTKWTQHPHFRKKSGHKQILHSNYVSKSDIHHYNQVANRIYKSSDLIEQK